jgi:hypothetical protein
MGYERHGNAARRLERRTADRRRERHFRFVERRTGFERRGSGEQGVGPRTSGTVASLRDSPVRFAALLVLLNLLNLADFGCTLLALQAGVAEANPFMAELFSQGPVAAGVTKSALVLLTSGLLWRLRTYRKTIRAALLLLVGMSAVLVYHVIGLAACCWR